MCSKSTVIHMLNATLTIKHEQGEVKEIWFNKISLTEQKSESILQAKPTRFNGDLPEISLIRILLQA